MLALRDLQLRYRQTLFGVGWAVLQPALGLVTFSFVFGHLAGIPSNGVPYPVFVLSALVVWFFISSSVGAAAESLVVNRALVTEIWFPRILAPAAAAMALIPDLLIGLVLIVPVFAAYGVTPPLQVFTLPLWLAGAVAVAVGAGLWLSAANVLYRDVRYALTFLLQLWFFISPVVFPSTLFPDGWRYVFALNPLVGVIDGVRWALIDVPVPTAELLVSATALIVLLVGGAIYFQMVERVFADRI